MTKRHNDSENFVREHKAGSRREKGACCLLEWHGRATNRKNSEGKERKGKRDRERKKEKINSRCKRDSKEDWKPQLNLASLSWSFLSLSLRSLSSSSFRLSLSFTNSTSYQLGSAPCLLATRGLRVSYGLLLFSR